LVKVDKSKTPHKDIIISILIAKLRNRIRAPQGSSHPNVSSTIAIAAPILLVGSKTGKKSGE
jgi:hypothetical protein